MKPLRFLWILCLLHFYQNRLNAQSITNAANNIFHFKLLVEAPIYECNILGQRLDSMVQIAPQGAKLTKVDSIGGNYIIRFWVWEKQEILSAKLNYTDNTKSQHRYFLINSTEFRQKAIPQLSRKSSFVIGSTVIPFRIRPKDFEFSGEFSFGTNFGALIPLSDNQDISLNLIGGIHLTQITLDSIDTRGVVSGTDSESAISPIIGAVFQFSKAQVGFFVGWDYLSGEENGIWIYQGKPWISIGVGASIFSTSNNGTVNINRQKQ